MSGYVGVKYVGQVGRPEQGRWGWCVGVGMMAYVGKSYVWTLAGQRQFLSMQHKILQTTAKNFFTFATLVEFILYACEYASVSIFRKLHGLPPKHILASPGRLTSYLWPVAS
jgi:hypothetical protein